MPTLTIHRGHQAYAAPFEGAQRLSALLEEAGQPLGQPCGGRGVCGKCAVLLTDGAEGHSSMCLACRTVISGDAHVILPEDLQAQIEADAGEALAPVQPMPGRFGAAVDVGTTTLALRLHDLHTGACLAVTTMLNPQTAVAADVIGRIDAAMQGRLPALQASVTGALQTLLQAACARAEVSPEAVGSLVATGNTTMLYLLTGRDPARLSRAPFEADCLFGGEISLLGRRCYLPPCLHAFVGADTVCALLAGGLCSREETALLSDVGTNGEIALWRGGRLYIASTAAGPAFEGAGISCGCGSIPGAINRVTVENGTLTVRTIGGGKPVGLCGSGLVDAAAALLETGVIDGTGAMEEDAYPLAEGVLLTRRDVRALQLAKAAIAAGTDSLLHAAGCREEEVAALWLAGGFGSHLTPQSAVRIGLIPEALAQKARIMGNAALHGASMLLLDTSLRRDAEAMGAQAHHVRLDGNAYFSRRYVEAMLFDDEE